MPKSAVTTIKSSVRNFLESSYYKLSRHHVALGCDDYKSIVFLCYGNIIRSPFCEFYLKNKLKDIATIEIVSAGFFEKQNRPSPENAQLAAKILDIDLTTHASKTITEEMVKKSTLVIGMHYSHYQLFQKHFPMDTNKFMLLKHISFPRSAFLSIADPYGHPLEAFSTCYFELQRCLDRLIEKIIQCYMVNTEQTGKELR